MRTNRRTVGIPGTARRRSWGNGRRAADEAASRGTRPEGGRAERRERAEPEDEKKGPLESRRRGAERNEEQTAPVPAGRWPTARSGGPMGAATGNRDGLNRNLYEEISLLYVACGEKMRGRACRVGGAKPAAGVRLPKGAATIEQVRHRAMGSAGAGRGAAAVGKRRRERDAELQIQAPRLTVRR